VNRRPIRKFQAEIIDPLAAGIVALLFRRQPVVHDAVAQRQRRSLCYQSWRVAMPGGPLPIASRSLASTAPLIRPAPTRRRLAERRKIHREKWIWQAGHP